MLSLTANQERLVSNPAEPGSKQGISKLQEVNEYIKLFSPQILEWHKRFEAALVYDITYLQSESEILRALAEKIIKQILSFARISSL